MKKADKKYFSVLLAGMLSLGIISCVERTETVMDGKMNFSAYIGNNVTKVTETSWDGGEVVAIKAEYGENDTEVKTYTVNADGSMTVTEGTEPFEWYGDAFSLKAWYPYSVDGRLILTDQSSRTKFFGCDLLYCATTAVGQNILLHFEHKMCRVRCILQNYDGYTKEQASQAKITVYGYGSVVYQDGLIAPEGQPGQEILTFTQVAKENQDWFYGEAMTVPCEMWNKPLIKIEIGGDSYIYTPTAAEDNGRNTGVLSEGSRQDYFFNINQGNYSVTVSSDGIDEWIPDDNGSVTPEPVQE